MNEDDLGDGMLPVKDHAVGKLQALHDEDYEIQQVLADLVDNSIDAGSTEIDIGFEDCFYPGEQKEYNFLSGEGNYLIIKDNGRGVDPERLQKALSRGHRRDYDEWELGHFGVGLKDSSFSQAYEITLFTKQKDGDLQIIRYSSCAVKSTGVDIHLLPEAMVGDFAWMTQTEGWEDAMEHFESNDHGTVVLLEGMHKIEGIVTADDPDSRDVYINKVRDQCENYLRVAFEYYLREGGADIPISYTNPETGEQSKKMDQVKILFNEDRLDPLDPFCRDMVDPHSNYGTLVWEGKIHTPVTNRKAELSVSIYIIPNINHPEYTARRKKQEENLKSAFGKGAYGLQGLYIYRNMRLIDAAGTHPWKSIFGEVDNQRTHLRWEVHLPPGRDVGTADSEFRVNKSKRDITLTPRITKALKKAIATSKQRWHPLDPEPNIGMSARAKIRLNNDKGDKTDWQRFKGHSGCNLCKDYMHKTEDHKCSICNKKGSEMSCCQPKCTICSEWGHEKATHQCALCGDVGHEGGCQTSEPTPEKPDPTAEGEGAEGISGGEAIASLAVNSTTSGDPVKVEFEGSIFKITVNREHQLFRDFIDAVKSLDPDDRIETKED